MSEKSKDGKTVICVLLPFCVELETDIFLNLLRIVVARGSHQDDHQFDAIKAGFSTETLYIKSNDLLVNWKELNSNSQRIRQMKLLGLWSMYNYPLLVTKLLTESCQAIEKKTVEVIGDPVKSAEAVNEVIFRKMKLRIAELNVCYSTLSKLKHFVKVPIHIDKFNGVRISPSIKLFEIADAVTENCWKALQFGSYVSDKQPTVPRKLNRQQNEQGVTIRGGPQLLPVAKRLRLDVTTRVESGEKESSSVDGSRLIHSAEASRAVDTIEISTIESIRNEVFEMRKEMDDLSKLYHPEGQNTECPETESVVSRRNKEISQLKSDAEKLVKENEMLNGLIERNTSLTNALQKGLDSSFKMNGVLENQIQVLTDKLSMAEKLSLEMAEKNVKLERELFQSKNCAASVDAQNKIQDLTRRLSETDKLNLELLDKKVKLEQDLVDSKHHTVTIEVNLKSRIQELSQKLSEVEHDLLESKSCAASVDAQNQIKDLTRRLSETDKLNLELLDKKVKLEQDLVDSKHHTVTIEVNLKSRIQELSQKLSEVEHDLLESKSCAASVDAQNEIQDLMKRLSESQKYNHEVYHKNVKLERDLIDSIDNAVINEANLESRIQELTQKLSEVERDVVESKNRAASVEAMLQNEIQDLKKRFSETAKSNQELYNQNLKIDRDLVDFKHHAANIEANLQSRIQDFTHKSFEAENKKLELSEKIRKLEVELIETKKFKEDLNSLKDNANTLVAEYQNQTLNFETSLKEAKKKEFLLITTNEKLEEELKGRRIKGNESVESLDKPEYEMDLKSEDEYSEDEYSEDEDLNTDTLEEDPIVKEFRKNLEIVEFGWLKFFETKNCIACPGFVYPPDEDGKQRAQQISPDGYVRNRKNIFFMFDPHFPDKEKDKTGLRMLKRFNGRFKTSFK